MLQPAPLEPVDYLVIGHITKDVTPIGPRLGGTASYASLTANALGLRVGIVTSWGGELPIDPLKEISIANYPSEISTTFENISTSHGRVQYIHHLAQQLDLNLIPVQWRNPLIVHLGPVCQEVDPSLVRHFPRSFIGLTPQGWLRTWDNTGQIKHIDMRASSFVLPLAGAVVISFEDVEGDETIIEEMAAACRVLVVTDEAKGARVYWSGDVRWFPAPELHEVDSTGAGDIFAATFFTRLLSTRDPWEAARFATQLASLSITRPGLDGIPTPEEIQAYLVEVL